MAGEHTVKSFGEELNHLNDTVKNIMRTTEEQIGRALQAVANGDEILATRVRDDDAKVNALERELQECSIRLLALREPKGRDLRNIIAAMRISVDVERVGDYAVNVARKAPMVHREAAAALLADIEQMGVAVCSMIEKVRQGFDNCDAAMAVEAWRQDDQVDDLYARIVTYSKFQLSAHRDPEELELYPHILMMAKALERIGDHLTNVAEHIHYLAEGIPLVEAVRE